MQRKPAAMGVAGLWREVQAGAAAGGGGGGGVRALGGAGEGHAALLAELEGRVVAVDLALWSCHATAADPGQMFIRGRHLVGAAGAAVKLAVERATHLLRHGAVPLGVVEGITPAAKADAVCRRGGRAPAVSSAAPRLTQAARISRAMAAALQAMGLPVVQAPGEAEAFCAALVEIGVADCVASDDVDACIYGAPAVFRDLHVYVNCPEKSRAVLVTRGGFLEALGLDSGLEADAARAALGVVAALAGHDYNGKGRRGIGPKKAAALVRQAAPDFETVLSDSDGTLACYRELDRQWRGALSAAEKVKRDGVATSWSRPDAVRLQAALRSGETGLPWGVEQCRLNLLPLLLQWDLEHGRAPGGAKHQEFALKELRRVNRRSGTAGIRPWTYEVVACPAPRRGEIPSALRDDVELLNSARDRPKLRHLVRMSLVRRHYPEVEARFEEECRYKGQKGSKRSNKERPPDQRTLLELLPRARPARVRKVAAEREVVLGEEGVGKGGRSRPDAAAARKRCVAMGLLAKDSLDSKRCGPAADVIDLTEATPSPPQATGQAARRAETIDLSDS